MSKYELEKLIEKLQEFENVKHVEKTEDLDDLYYINKELHATLMGMHLTLSYYCT